MRTQDVVSDVDGCVCAAVLREIGVGDCFCPVGFLIWCCGVECHVGEEADVVPLVIVCSSRATYALDWLGIGSAAESNGFNTPLYSHKVAEERAR